MDMQKEREAFQEWFGTTTTYQTLWDFISTHQTNIKSVFVKKNGKTYQNDCVQIAWEAWQAAKARAVPKEQTTDDKCVHFVGKNKTTGDVVCVMCGHTTEAAQEQNQ